MRVPCSKAFTLIEVLISLALSSFILLALTQTYQSTSRFLQKSLDVMVVNRKICLLANQCERDLSSAFIPIVQEEITPNKSEQPLPAQPLGQDSPEEKRKKEDEQRKTFFVGTEGDCDSFKYNDKTLKAFGRLTFITSNPLQIYGNKRQRFVRVAYELTKDKEHSNRERICYKLVRKESNDIIDAAMKISEFDYEKLAKQTIREQVLVNRVKSMHIEYIMFKEDEEKKEKQKEELRSFVWGEKDYTQGVVPQRMEITLVLWNNDFSGEQVLHTMVPVLSYPTEKPPKTPPGQQLTQQLAQLTPQADQNQAQPVAPAAPTATPPAATPQPSGA